MTTTTLFKIETLALRLETALRERYRADFSDFKHAPSVAKGLEDRACAVHVIPGPKYTKVNVGGSARYMVENETEVIYGTKGYGVVHKGHVFGTLDTADEWNWGGYRATRK